MQNDHKYLLLLKSIPGHKILIFWKNLNVPDYNANSFAYIITAN